MEGFCGREHIPLSLHVSPSAHWNPHQQGENRACFRIGSFSSFVEKKEHRRYDHQKMTPCAPGGVEVDE